jgi:hypothetical protein
MREHAMFRFFICFGTFSFIFACLDVADSKALLHHSSGSINNASSSSALRAARKSAQIEVPSVVMWLPS